MKSGEKRLLGRRSPRVLLIFLFLFPGLGAIAQSTSNNTDTIRGVVINSVTREPIGRALVSSPDNRFAALTNSEGRFEFTLTKDSSANAAGSDANQPGDGGIQPGDYDRPYALMARKPGFLAEPNLQANNLQSGAPRDLTLVLTPEAVIAGTVTLPTSDAPDNIVLQLFRKQVQDGRGRWVPAGGQTSMSDGEFRFADLQAGTYKLLTQELLDRDPLTSDPRDVDPFAADARGLMFGYPPVYYQSASDFASASPIQLAAGETQTVNLTLVKQPYYRVKVPVVVPDGGGSEGLSLTVYANGHKGPGFALGYDQLHHAIEGLLPSGTYTIEAASFQPSGAAAMETITVKGAPGNASMRESPSMVLVPNGLIAVNVKEEFTSSNRTGYSGTQIVKGPRRYLTINLEPAEDFGTGRNASLRNPTAPGAEALFIEGAPPGSYWVQVYSSRGYPATIRSGNLDLLHQPLVVGVGGSASPIEITMRDDMAQLSGMVAGVTPALEGVAANNATYYPSAGEGHVYCIPLSDSPGQFTDIWVHPDGSFDSAELAPGTYRLLAFDRAQLELEYRNPEAMQAYDSSGTVVRLAGGQKERVTLQLISTGPAAFR